MNQEKLKYYKEYFNKQKGQKYPCSNQIVRCAIVTGDRDKAINFMKDKEIVKKLERKNYIAWFLCNGEQWEWRKWNKNCRGHRFYKVVVDKNISDNIFDLLVLPCCVNYCCSMEII
jgi:hypothetical protein